ncbi:AAA family ATPase [Candidatus Sumerlaeota bacterium]|nr:AAA family ATPase [Candidatus Sumerlaeota bacterium]
MASGAASPTPAPAPARKTTQYGELETLIRARYPLIYVVSWEEGRVMRELNAIAKRLNKSLYYWTITDGLRLYRESLEVELEGMKGTKDPLGALRAVREKNDPSIFVLNDFHAFIRESAVTRGLRELGELLRSTYNSIVLLSPTLEIPPELEKEVTIIDFPLPSRAQIRELLQSIAADLKGNPDLTIDLSDGGEEAILGAAIGLTLNEAENVFAKTLVSAGRLSMAEVPLIFSEKEQIVRKTGLLEYVKVYENMNNVGGMNRLKEWVVKRTMAFGAEARRFGLPAPKGLLILGVQGCGKSLCAKAVPNLWKVPLLRLDMGRLFGSLVGSSEQNVRRAIQVAESVAPVVLWIDEIDKGFSGLDSSSFSDSGTTSRVFGTLLTWFQEKESAVFVIATANNVEVLPPELLRKGRFDEIFFVDLPNQAERESIFRIHLAKRRRSPDKFDVARLAAAAEGFSGAEIEQAIISALFDAFSERTDITTAHVLHSIEETVPLSRLMEKEIQHRREWADGRTRPAT